MRLWAVDGDELHSVPERRLDLESRLEEWLDRDISVLGLNLLVIGRQVATAYNGIIDLLCIDDSGNLVVVELKKGLTPREVTAQTLDYASWVAALDASEIVAIADAHLRDDGPLSAAFERTFRCELPETMNSDTRMVVVGTGLDASSERIIRFLSDRYDLNINAVTFQYFEAPGGTEMLGRVFLIEPDEARQKDAARKATRRRRPPTKEEMAETAVRLGIGGLYDAARSAFSPFFNQPWTTMSALAFGAPIRNGKAIVVLNLQVPAATTEGLPFQIYAKRACQHFGLTPEELRSALPADTKPWQYPGESEEWWGGYQGVLRTESDIQRLRSALDGGRGPRIAVSL